MEQTRMGLAGYDPDQDDMKGIFMAKGPDFKSDGGVYPGIELVDVYQIFTKLLNIPAQPHNGTWDHVRDMLADPNIGHLTMWSPILSALCLVISLRTLLLS